jgi:LPXTG-site transpeptidase (sortase) family protein
VTAAAPAQKKLPLATVGLPVTIAIPRIRVQTTIEQLGLMPDRKLDTPKNRLNAGWYALGPRPGETGNAVIDGHLTVPRADGVFRHLDLLQAGDTIYVKDDTGQSHAFRVREMRVYNVAAAPMNRIFGSADGVHLNLITCAGVWSKKLNHYDKRLIIYADAAQSPRPTTGIAVAAAP